jgi:hypothetical protein
MGFEIKESGNIVLCPTGSHVARCFLALDLGTHPEEFQGEFKGNVKKVRLGFELPLKTHMFDEKRGQEPFTLSQKFTYSMHEKAALRKFLEAWKGEEFQESKLKAFMKVGIPCLIGKTCLINVAHKEKKTGGHSAVIKSVMPLPEGMACPDPVMKPIVWSVDAGRDAVFETFKKWQQEEISKCLEWRPKTDTGNADPNHTSAPEEGKEEEENPF